MPEPTSHDRHWGRIADAQRLLGGVSVDTVRRAITRGDIYAERVGPRLIRVDLNSISGRPLQYAAGDDA